MIKKSITRHLKSITEIAKKYSVFIFDMDGILWSGNNHIPYGFDCLNMLGKMGK